MVPSPGWYKTVSATVIVVRITFQIDHFATSLVTLNYYTKLWSHKNEDISSEEDTSLFLCSVCICICSLVECDGKISNWKVTVWLLYFVSNYVRRFHQIQTWTTVKQFLTTFLPNYTQRCSASGWVQIDTLGSPISSCSCSFLLCALRHFGGWSSQSLCWLLHKHGPTLLKPVIWT